MCTDRDTVISVRAGSSISQRSSATLPFPSAFPMEGEP